MLGPTVVNYLKVLASEFVSYVVLIAGNYRLDICCLKPLTVEWRWMGMIRMR
jgi:hypothetical protein